jgi:type IV pilus assembly protein PilC
LLWTYTALDKEGQIVKGSKEAESRYQLLQESKQEGLTLIAVTQEEEEKPDTMGSFGLPWLKVSAKVVTLFTRQLADLSDAGVPLAESLRSLQKFEPSKRFSEIVGDVYSKILQGQSFSDALGSHPEVFDNIYVGMVKVGESSGRLPDVLAGLAEFRERDEDLRGRLRSALAYPIFTLGFSLILCWALVAHVLPGFIPIWTGSGLDLHKYPITEFLLDLSDLTKSFWDEAIIIALVTGLVLLYHNLMRTSEAQHKKDTFFLKVPVLRDFVQMGAVARICNTLGVLTQSGVGLVNALALASRTTGNTAYQVALETVSKEVQEGNPFSTALSGQDVFPPMVQQMVGIGEQTGKMDEMFPRMANYYDRQLDGTLKTMVALMEPLTMVIVGGIVFVFVLGVFMPIMGIVQALQSQM